MPKLQSLKYIYIYFLDEIGYFLQKCLTLVLEKPIAGLLIGRVQFCWGARVRGSCIITIDSMH